MKIENLVITIDQIKALREATGASPVEIKKALEQTGGDMEKAKEILQALGKKVADKKGANEALQGLVDFYVHPNGKTGVLLDIRCQTDFVAKSPEFKTLAHEICLQIVALNPETPESLLAQPWMKGDSKTIKNLMEETTAKVGENIEVKRFARYEI